jgi:uncharacterized protein (TIGR00730 family)
VPELRSLCVYCGSNFGADPAFAAAARDLGSLLARRGIRVVYGGGKVGLMGVLADTVLAEGGEVVGVIPQHLIDREIGHAGLTELRVVGSMHERKALMAELSDAFVALPGGIGTLEELIEVYTWGQLGLHRKPLGLLDVAGYYGALAEFLDHAVACEFLRPQHRAMLAVESEPAALLGRLERAEAPPLPKWLSPPATTAATATSSAPPANPT